MILYHGSKSGIKGSIRPDASRETCDFGKGFYLGDKKEQPISLVSSYEDSILYTMELDICNIENKLEFKDNYASQLDWALYIAYNRKIGNLQQYEKLDARYKMYNEAYDIIIGLIADDKMTQVLNQFYAGVLCDKAMLEALQSVKLGKQYVIKNKELCLNVKIVEEHKMTQNERKLGTALATNRINQTNQIISQVQTKYRRAQNVKYFDEIIKEWNI